MEAASRIDIQIKQVIESLKKNNRKYTLQLPYPLKFKTVPNNIYEDQERVKITIRQIEYGQNKQKSDESKITYELSLCYGTQEYKNSLKDKVLVIPNGIQYLIINNPVIDCNIDFSEAIDLEYLEYGYYELGARMGYITDDEPKITHWPPNLKYLILHNYPYSLSSLPNGLQYLRLPREVIDPLDNLPDSLIGLVFQTANSCHKYNMGMNNLPLGLRYLALPGRVDCELENLPPNLEVLNLGGDEYTQSLNCLPDSIKYLTLGNSIIPIEKLPRELKELTIFYDLVANDGIYSRDTYNILEDMNFPDGFEKLIIKDDFRAINSEMRDAINELIMEKMKKSDSHNGKQIKIDYRC